MQDVRLYGIYTISPLHCGTGQTAGAVDLPVARESHTRLPFIPGTGLKGVARDVIEKHDGAHVEGLFGSAPPQQSGSQDDTVVPPADDRRQTGSDGEGRSERQDAAGTLKAGNLLFTDARLLALPVRSLQRPFLYVTSPLVLRRLERELRAFGVEDVLPANWVCPRPRGNRDGDAGNAGSDGRGRQVLVADQSLAGQPLVLEDLCYDAGQVVRQAMVGALARQFVGLLAADEALGRHLMPSGLVVVPDEDLCDLAQRTLPVAARTQLTPGKTTDTWKDELTGRKYSGNLWYEEALPPDTLLYAFVGAPDLDRAWKGSGTASARLHEHADSLRRVQIGGNETVGAGQCWWTFWAAASPEGEDDVR